MSNCGLDLICALPTIVACVSFRWGAVCADAFVAMAATKLAARIVNPTLLFAKSFMSCPSQWGEYAFHMGGRGQGY